MRIRRICAHGAVASLCFVLAVGLYTALAQPAKPAPSTMTPPQGALRVGMTPNFPPMVFTDQGTITGLEADFAREVGKELARRMVLIELPWKELIPALEAGRIDVIMSGMSVTETRKQRVRFVQPYQRVGQMALLRKDGPLKLGSPTLLTMTTRRVGFEAGTTGAKYVKANLTQAQHVPVASVAEGLQALRDGTIDVFIHDAVTTWQVESDKTNDTLKGMHWPLTEEYLAWAVRKSDETLHRDLEAVLQRWKRTGRLQAFFNTWLKFQVR